MSCCCYHRYEYIDIALRIAGRGDPSISMASGVPRARIGGTGLWRSVGCERSVYTPRQLCVCSVPIQVSSMRLASEFVGKGSN